MNLLLGGNVINNRFDNKINDFYLEISPPIDARSGNVYS